MMKILRYIFLAFLFLGVLPAAAEKNPPAPPTDEMVKELQDFKIKYLIQEMDLPADKQADFTRIYTQYCQSNSALFKDMFSRFTAMKAKKQPTDADYLALAERMASFKSREGQLENNCFQQLKTLLTPSQLFKLKKAESKFDHKVREMRGKKHKK